MEGKESPNVLPGAGNRPVPRSDTQEMTKITREQAAEYSWWRDVPPYEDERAIQSAIDRGELVRVIDRPDLGYKISDTADRFLRYIRPGLSKIIADISTTWLDYLRRSGEPHDNLFLMLTSFVRTKSYQKKLIELGYPAVKGDTSTHLRGAVVDIGMRWLEKNRPRVFEALRAALAEVASRYEVNIIYEETIGAFHIAASPHEANLDNSGRGQAA